MKFDEIWEIDSFLLLDSVLSSQAFGAGRGIWKMKLFPLGIPMSKEKRYVAVYLQLVDVSSFKNTRSQGIYATPRFSLLDARGKKVWSERRSGYEAQERRFVLSSHSATVYGYERFVPRKYLVAGGHRFLPDGKLILRCQLQIREGPRDVDEIPVCPQSMVDFSQLLNVKKPSTPNGNAAAVAPTFSDVVFRVDGAEFQCHKAIVSRRSQVFKNLFIAYDNDGFEISTDQEFGLELKSYIFEDALLHIYGSTPRILSLPFVKFNRCWCANVKKVASLMLLANKYEIKDLTQISEAKLIELFRVRSQDSAIKRSGKRTGGKRDADFFYFEDKPFSLETMTQIAERVTASGLAVYLATCQQLRLSL